MKKFGEVYYKEIPLLPTAFSVEVFVSQDKEPLVKAFAQKYKGSEEYYEEAILGSMVSIIETDRVRHIVCVLKSFDPAIVAHEAVHITWALEHFVHFGYCYEHQEIQAYYISYLMEEILKMQKDKDQHILNIQI